MRLRQFEERDLSDEQFEVEWAEIKARAEIFEQIEAIKHLMSRIGTSTEDTQL